MGRPDGEVDDDKYVGWTESPKEPPELWVELREEEKGSSSKCSFYK